MTPQAFGMVEQPQSRCRVGIARIEITPPVGSYHRMWGAAVHDRAESVHRPLFATALWLEPLDSQPTAGGDRAAARQVVIALDHCILDRDELLGFRQAVAASTGASLEQVCITLSHTHGAGWMSRSRADLPGGEMIGPYLDRLAGQLAAISVAARDGAVESTLVYGQGKCSLAAHRDLWDPAAGRYVCGFNPTGSADDTLLVGRVTDVTGAVRCVLVNYACHPTTLAWDNRAISPDWVGGMREVIESTAGGVCLFWQGAAGDLGPREGFVGDPEVADRNGRQVGHAVLAVLESLPPAGTRFVYAGPVVSGTWIGTWRHEAVDEAARVRQAAWNWRREVVELPYRADLPTREATLHEQALQTAEEQRARAAWDSELARRCRAKVEQMTRQLARLESLPAGPSYPCHVTVGQLGDALFVLVPGELYQVFQVALRERFAPRPVWVATMTNDWHPGYIPAAASYGHDIYQAAIAAVAPGGLEKLTDAVAQLLESFAASDTRSAGLRGQSAVR
jgi:hypothetical protein